VFRLTERFGRRVSDRRALATVPQRHTIDAASNGEVTTRVRAVQTAFFREWLLSMRLDPARQRGAPGVAPRLAPEAQRRPRLVRSPTRLIQRPALNEVLELPIPPNRWPFSPEPAPKVRRKGGSYR
jgi:hypothetical protein